METVFLNGSFIPKDKAFISPDDRGFLFADGIYEVVRWYAKDFFDMPGHMWRLRRSLHETGIRWNGVESFPGIARELVLRNGLDKSPAMVYLQVTRGAARRTHFHPVPEVTPTSYAYAFGFTPDADAYFNGIRVLLKEDIRWHRCDIKSVALIANTMSFNEAYTKGQKECIFSRNGTITEGAHSNIFFVLRETLLTHPESNLILSGISRKNVIRMASDSAIPLREEAIPERDIQLMDEAFITNTSAEVTPVTEIGGITVGNGKPGPVTRLLQERFRKETDRLKAL